MISLSTRLGQYEPLLRAPYELPGLSVVTGDGLKANVRFGGRGVEVTTLLGDHMSSGKWIDGRYIEHAESQGGHRD